MHKPFSLEKLKSRVAGRRASETALVDLSLQLSTERRNLSSNPAILITDEPIKLAQRIRASSLSVPVHHRSRSRSVSKKQAKELIRQETSHVIQKKLHQVLAEIGVQDPIPLRTTNNSLNGPVSKLIKVYVLNSNDCLYLPPALLASFTYEDVENGGNEIPQTSRTPPTPNPEWNDEIVSEDDNTDTEESALELHENLHSFKSPNYLCTKIDSDTSIPHVFAVIVDVEKETSVKSVRFDFELSVLTLWPIGDMHNRSHSRESYRIGHLEWVFAMKDADYYINTKNSNDTKVKRISHSNLALRTRKYKLVDVRQLALGTDELNRKRSLFETTSNSSSDTLSTAGSPLTETYKAGLYVFLLPVIFPYQIPATIVSLNGSLQHRLSVSISKISEKLNRKAKTLAFYNLPMVRTPPSLANSIADKPIYVNRVWNDALHYIITFPKKYVSLGSEHTINVKLVPLVKDVILKRIKFNVLERITYVSRDLSKEYEYDGEDPFLMKGLSHSKVKERVVPVCELKTKHRSSYAAGTEPYKEEVIKCPDNNLLNSCYEAKDGDDDPLSKPEKTTMIASPLDINIALPFLTTRSDKVVLNGDDVHEDAKGSISSPTLNVSSPTRSSFSSPTRGHTRNDSSLSGPLCPSSPIIGALETHISHLTNDQFTLADADENVLKLDSTTLLLESSHNLCENVHQGYTTVSKALAPDSNFRHIQISHKLQICFRISKTDPKDNNRMHHYEVVVDTPIILLSARCNDESIQLPKYDELGVDGLSAPRTSRDINFKTPTYSKNGVSIRPLNQYSDDELPSFEEATSTTTSPLMRSISLGEEPISRIPSVTPSDPAPAYERSQSIAHDVLVPLNIDDFVTGSATARKQSYIRNSLSSSFAPVSRSEVNTVSSSSSKGLSRPSELEDTSSNEPQSLLSSESAERLSSNSTDELTATNESNKEGTSECPQYWSGQMPTDLSVLDLQFYPPLSISQEQPLDAASIVDGAESIYTQDTQFVQKLSLVQNASLDNITTTSSYSARRTTDDLGKMLTDDLNETESLFHAY